MAIRSLVIFYEPNPCYRSLKEFDKSRVHSRRPSRPSSPPADLGPPPVVGIGGKGKYSYNDETDLDIDVPRSLQAGLLRIEDRGCDGWTACSWQVISE
jgi:hypothetical protein